eukprot:1157522-Pelagomonas_calceolata.AAC.1
MAGPTATHHGLSHKQCCCSSWCAISGGGAVVACCTMVVSGGPRCAVQALRADTVKQTKRAWLQQWRRARKEATATAIATAIHYGCRCRCGGLLRCNACGPEKEKGQTTQAKRAACIKEGPLACKL